MENQFQEVLTYQVATTDTVGRHRGVVKARDITYTSDKKVQIEGDAVHSSTVVLHREGDVVKAIEVVCSCGKPTLISLEYDAE